MKPYLFLLALFLCLPANAAGLLRLRLWFADGTTRTVFLYTRPKVTFEGDQVVITSSVATMSYPASDVLRFTYGTEPLPTEASSPTVGDTFHQNGEQILFDAKVKASDVQLFTEDGKRLKAKATIVNGRPTLSLTSLPAGVYLLKVNGRTSKILKK